MQKEKEMLHADEVFHITGRLFWENERLKERVEWLTAALAETTAEGVGKSVEEEAETKRERDAREEEVLEAAREKLAREREREARREEVLEALRKALGRRVETLEGWLAGWAGKYGYAPIHAARYLEAWIGMGRRPTGCLSKAIIEALERDTGVRICGAQTMKEQEARQ